MRHFEMTDLANFRAKPFLEFLSREQIATLRDVGHLRQYTSGQFIQSRGDAESGIAIVETGAAQAGIYSSDGGFILTSFLGPGQTFGEFTVFTDLPRTHDLAASGPTQLLHISGKRFLQLCEAEPAYLFALTRATLLRSYIALEMLHAVRILPLLPRVAKYLLILTPELPAEPRLKLRQSDLAATLGLSRASLNRALSDLETLGLISRGYASIRIECKSALNDWLEAHIGETEQRWSEQVLS
ncbi:MAG: Crp/Fnr family transcriptional regulator [Pseudomonadota bacterium]